MVFNAELNEQVKRLAPHGKAPPQPAPRSLRETELAELAVLRHDLDDTRAALADAESRVHTLTLNHAAELKSRADDAIEARRERDVAVGERNEASLVNDGLTTEVNTYLKFVSELNAEVCDLKIQLAAGRGVGAPGSPRSIDKPAGRADSIVGSAEDKMKVRLEGDGRRVIERARFYDGVRVACPYPERTFVYGDGDGVLYLHSRGGNCSCRSRAKSWTSSDRRLRTSSWPMNSCGSTFRAVEQRWSASSLCKTEQRMSVTVAHDDDRCML